MMRWLRIVASWFGGFRPPPGAAPVEDSDVQALVSHVHLWGPCKWNGQYWYARCIRYEWCTARLAC